MSDRAPDARWHGLPVYRCQVCGRYERVNNLEAVLEHERSHNPTPRARTSPILGPAGESITVLELEADRITEGESHG